MIGIPVYSDIRKEITRKINNDSYIYHKTSEDDTSDIGAAIKEKSKKKKKKMPIQLIYSKDNNQKQIIRLFLSIYFLHQYFC